MQPPVSACTAQQEAGRPQTEQERTEAYLQSVQIAREAMQGGHVFALNEARALQPPLTPTTDRVSSSSSCALLTAYVCA